MLRCDVCGLPRLFEHKPICRDCARDAQQEAAFEAQYAAQEFEYDGRVMDEEAERDMEGSVLVAWNK